MTNPSILYTFPDEATWLSSAENAGLIPDPTGPILGTGSGDIDVVGLIIDQEAIIDENGDVITPATFLPGWHINIYLPRLAKLGWEPPESWDQYLTGAWNPKRQYAGMPGPAPNLNTTNTPYDRLSIDHMNNIEKAQINSALSFAEAKLARIEGRNPSDPEPQWQAFAAALVNPETDPGINTLLSTLQTTAPVLVGMLTVGLGQAAQTGDLTTFENAWTAINAAGLISSKLSSDLIALASSFDLPQEFIDLLN